MTIDARSFTGTERFAVERCLGSGGFGTVYQTYDRQRRAHVALKVLHRADPASLLALKREFRALADLSHPNLVSLYELLSEDDSWFISMELVKGNEFVAHVDGTARIAMSETRASDQMETGAEVVIAPRPLRPSLTATNLERLERALYQLAKGLRYLHGEGRLHRDIKPSNVLVTDEGRVVLLDFGLVAELGSASPRVEGEISGTPAYMAPLRDSGAPFTEADDWYSVGVMLFEVLTGTLPFTGGLFEVLQAKSSKDAPSPRALVPFVPIYLDELCRGLLSRDPARRLEAAASLSQGSRVGAPIPPAVHSPGAPAVPLVGRATHLEALDHAFRSTKAGHSVTVYVHGSSGMGKTALVRQFLQSLPQRYGSVITLSGRCFERESVPYKALDSIVDSLSEYLRGVPREQVKQMLPRDILALARVFPVLRRVEAIVKAKHRVLEIPDALELRRRAFAAFRELLARLADLHSVVMFIDDLQWGDEDSAALLAEILRQPDAPALLLIATYRSEEATSSAALRRLLPDQELASGNADVRHLAVTELTPEQSIELAAMLRARGAAVGGGDVIVREAGGNPFLINELVRYAKPSGAEAGELTLDEVIFGRVKALPAPSRRLLEVLAVFGQPLDRELASQAAGIGAEEMESVSLLRAQRLSRTRVMDDREELETYHDRIRETVVAHLGAGELREHHRALATGLAALDNPDPEMLAVHFQGAGEPVKAAFYSVAAADRAADALAFDRAARLYRLALDLDPAMDRDRQRSIEVRLGDALASAGRGGQAARAYLAAANDSEPRSQLELRRRAAEQLLRSGQIDDGFDTIRSVLAAIGMSLAKSPRRALLSMLLQRLRIRIRGLGFTERRVEDISPDELVRIDTCWSVAMGLGIVDNIRGADFQGRHLLLALNAGEPYRIARALGMEVAYAVVPGGRRARERSRRLGEMAQALAERVNHPQALGLVSLTRGTAAHLQGEWRTALELCERAERILDERCTGVGWELAASHLYSLLALYYLGELGELSRRLPILLQEARERDDLNAVANLRTRLSYLASLAADDVPGAKEEVRQGIAVWSRKGFTAQHFFELLALVEIAVYEGAGADAWAAIERSWADLSGSLLLRVQRIHIESLSFRARAAIAAAVDDRTRRTDLLRQAERAVKKLRSLDASHAQPIATLAAAGIEATAGRLDRAARCLDEAVGKLEVADMPLHLAAARRRLGEIGRSGKIEEADAWMTAHGIRNPRAWAQMLVPGSFEQKKGRTEPD
jgi:serine/threonine protein kinase/tetratricopeptide (TPR) repeat protein